MAISIPVISLPIVLPPAVRLAMLPWASSFGAEYGSFIGGFGGVSKTLAPSLFEHVS